MELSKGANAPVPTSLLAVVVSWQSEHPVDAHALLLADTDMVRTDRDLVFFNAPRHISQAVTLAQQPAPGTARLSVSLPRTEADVRRIIVAGSVDDGTFRDITELTVTIEAANGPVARFAITDSEAVAAMMFGEFYRRDDEWRFRAIAQGWASGLAGLVTEFGISVEEPADRLPARSFDPFDGRRLPAVSAAPERAGTHSAGSTDLGRVTHPGVGGGRQPAPDRTDSREARHPGEHNYPHRTSANRSDNTDMSRPPAGADPDSAQRQANPTASMGRRAGAPRPSPLSDDLDEGRSAEYQNPGNGRQTDIERSEYDLPGRGGRDDFERPRRGGSGAFEPPRGSEHNGFEGSPQSGHARFASPQQTETGGFGPPREDEHGEFEHRPQNKSDGLEQPQQGQDGFEEPHRSGPARFARPQQGRADGFAQPRESRPDGLEHQPHYEGDGFAHPQEVGHNQFGPMRQGGHDRSEPMGQGGLPRIGRLVDLERRRPAVQSPTPPPPPVPERADWHSDPENPTRMRWWDGSQWTGAAHIRQQPSPHHCARCGNPRRRKLFGGLAPCQRCADETDEFLTHWHTQAWRVLTSSGPHGADWDALWASLRYQRIEESAGRDALRDVALSYVERLVTFAFADGEIELGEFEAFEYAIEELQLRGPLVEDLRRRMHRGRLLCRLRSGDLPQVRTPGLHLDPEEKVHLDLPATHIRKLAKGPKFTEGRLIASNKKLRFVGIDTGTELPWNRVVSVHVEQHTVVIAATSARGGAIFEVTDPDYVAAALEGALRVAKRLILTPGQRDTRSIPQEVKAEVWQRDGGKCVECGESHYLEFDHIIPLSRGGATSASNLQILCRACNRSKGARI